MTSADRDRLEEALRALGELLASRGLRYEVVLIGGANLILQGLITRPTTRDLDLLGEYVRGDVRSMRPMPAELTRAVADVGRVFGLAPDWVNLAPDALLDLGLPAGFAARLASVDYGGLIVWFASRDDMICFKLYAAVDQGRRSRHLQDLRELRPTHDELSAAGQWTRTHDPSDGYRAMLVATLRDLGVEDADAGIE